MSETTQETKTDATQETAQVPENKQTENKTYTQSDLDKIVAQALDTREKNLRKQWESEASTERERLEQERLKSEGKLQEYIERLESKEREETLRKNTESVLKENDLLDLMDVFNSDLNKIDGRKNLATSLRGKIEGLVDKRVNEALQTKAPAAPKPTSIADQGNDPRKWSDEKWAAFKKNANNLSSR